MTERMMGIKPDVHLSIRFIDMALPRRPAAAAACDVSFHVCNAIIAGQALNSLFPGNTQGGGSQCV
jgi:hypothetical protein